MVVLGCLLVCFLSLVYKNKEPQYVLVVATTNQQEANVLQFIHDWRFDNG